MQIVFPLGTAFHPWGRFCWRDSARKASNFTRTTKAERAVSLWVEKYIKLIIFITTAVFILLLYHRLPIHKRRWHSTGNLCDELSASKVEWRKLPLRIRIITFGADLFRAKSARTLANRVPLLLAGKHSWWRRENCWLILPRVTSTGLNVGKLNDHYVSELVINFSFFFFL